MTEQISHASVVGAGSSPTRRRRRLLVALTAVVLVPALLIAGTVLVLSSVLGGNLDRVPDVFGPLDVGTRPPERPGVTFLLVGTDSRAQAPTTGTDAEADEGSARSDLIMLAQLAEDGSGASVVSIPRDSWVDIPGRGRAKINAAYAYGGPTLLVETVERLTQVRVDHFAVIDFEGFTSMVDAVGGIDVDVARATRNAGVDFHEGRNHLDGEKALAYVGQRQGLPGGDLDRARRQQNALRALLATVVADGVLTDPARLYELLDATTRSVDIDDTLGSGGLARIALQARDLRPGRVQFVTAPVSGLGQEGAQSVVYLDEAASARLWEALRTGTTAEYVAANPGAGLGDTPN